MLKRTISLLLCVVLVLTMVPAQAFASAVETAPTETVPETTATETMEMVQTTAATEPETTTAPETEAPTAPSEAETVPETEPETVPETEATEVLMPEETVDETVSEAASATVTSGTCGENLTWNFDESTRVLTISGTGLMDDFGYDDAEDRLLVPWSHINDDVLTVVVEEGVTSIGSYAFAWCSMQYVELPDSLTSIGVYAFRDCSFLDEIRIGGAVTSIGRHAFYRCSDLQAIVVAEDNPVYSSADGFLFDKNKETLLSCPHGFRGDYVVPDTVKHIADEAFYSTDITAITIPDSVISIGNSAFAYSTLKTAVLPNSITSIGGGAFYHCPLSSVNIPNSVTSIGGAAFSGCGMTSVTIPSTVTSMGDYVFSECANLESATIATARVTEGTFMECGKLRSVTLCDGVTSIGDWAFCSCYSLTDLVLPDSLTSIGEAAFDSCSALAEITLPNRLNGIGNSAFYGCESLTEITIPDSVINVGDYAFYCCGSLESISIGSGVSYISGIAFGECPNLQEIKVAAGNSTYYVLNGDLFDRSQTLIMCNKGKTGTYVIPDGITRIGKNAFDSCYNLTGITIANSVVRIGAEAFWYCTGLTDIKIPNSVTYIEHDAFYGCTGLTSIVIPPSVRYIESCAFWGCYELKEVYFQGNAPEACDIFDIQCTGYYPENNPTWTEEVRQTIGYDIVWESYDPGVVPDTPNANPSGTLKNGITWELDGTNLQITGSGEMENFASPYAVPWVDYYPFVQKVTIGEGITSIGEYAFAGNYDDDEYYYSYSIDRLILPASLRVVNKNAFQNCGIGLVLLYGRTEMDLQILEGNENLEYAQIVFADVLLNGIKDYCDNGNITINGSGSACAYYQTAPEQEICYVMDGEELSAQSDERGILMIPLGTFESKGKHNIDIQFTCIGNVELEPTIDMTASVNVTPLSFEQTWQLSLSESVEGKLSVGVDGKIGVAEAEATLGKIGAEVGVGGAMNISREYVEGNDTLELTADHEITSEVSFKSGITGEALKAKMDVIEASAGVKSTLTGSYGIKIDDFSEKNTDHIMAMGTFLLGEALVTSPSAVFLKPMYNSLAAYIYTKCDATVIAGSAAGLGAETGVYLGQVKVGNEELFSTGTAKASLTVTGEESRHTDGETEKSTSYKANVNLSALKIEGLDVDVKGAINKEFLGADIKVAAKETSDGESVETTYLNASEGGLSFFILGTEHFNTYNMFTFSGDSLKELREKVKHVDEYVDGKRSMMSVKDLDAIGGVLSDNDVPIPYSRLQKMQTVYSVPVDIGATVFVGLELGVELSYKHESSYTDAEGFALADTIHLSSESDELRNDVDEKSWDVVEKVIEAVGSLRDYAKNFYKEIAGTVWDGVKGAWCWIKGKGSDARDRIVSILFAEGGGGGTAFGTAWETSYAVDTLTVSRERRPLTSGVYSSDAADYTFSKAATIGRPFVIRVTDNATGEDVADFSDEPLEFTIRYAVEDLEAAGLSAQSAVVLDGGIAMYRYSDDGDYFEYIGGVNDLTAMTVTADITKPGQYVLAVDSCAPALSALDMSDFREMPTITASIDDLSGLDVSKFVFKLDGVVKVDSKNIAQHFNAEAGLFTYTVTEALAEGQHSMSFTLADTTGNTETYEYSFFVDLTAPTVSDVTVEGHTNEGSVVEIRANIRDENLTAVYAMFSKKLSDGTWSDEVGVQMGDMGDGLWGVDYEGDGSTVKVRICAVDIAENQTYSEAFEAKPYAESIEISQNYLALRVGQNTTLTAEVRPAEMAASVRWSVENQAVATVDESGKVTAKSAGTTYVIATVTDGENELTARCRIDVAQSIKLDGVKLGTNKLTTELYSTDYTKLDILLMLPQNYATSSDTAAKAEKLSAAISDAYFTDEAVRNLFTLNILDDRTVEIVPTTAAIDSEKLSKSYSGTITVVVEGTSYETDELALTVKTSKPKLKVKVENFNSFYSGQTQVIQVTGAAVTQIKAEALPEWLGLADNQLYLTEKAPQKNASGKVNLEIWTEEWAVPAYVTVSVKNTFKAPGLKLSATSIQLSNQPGSSVGVELQLLPKNKKESLSDLKVRSITAPEGYSIENYADGAFTLKAEDGFKAGKINLEVHFNGTDATLKLPITVKAAQVKLKLEKSSINLNAEIGDSALVGITTTPADYVISAPNFRLVDGAGNNKLNSGELEVRFEDSAVRINTTAKTPVGANYTLFLQAGGSKEVALKIKIVGGEASLNLKQSSNLDLTFLEQPAAIIANFKNYAGGKLEKFTYSITETKTGENVTKFFGLEEAGGKFYLTCTDTAKVSEKGAYVLNLKLTLSDGSEQEASLKLKIKRTAIKLKLSSGKLTLNKSINDIASVAVTCATKGYEFTKPTWKLMDKSGKQPADGKLDISWVDGKLQICTNAATEYGATYKLLVSAEEGAAPTALTVSILAEAKSAVTGTLKVKGNLDVIRSTAVLVIPSYKNCSAETDKTEELRIVRSDDKNVTDQFDIQRNDDGTFSVAIASGAEIDLTKKYQVQLVTTFGSTEIQAKPGTLSIKMGSAKVTAQVEGTLFAKDKNSRVTLNFSSADATLNDVARIEIKDAKYQDIFEIFDYGNGQFAIGFKDGKTIQSTKPIPLALNIFIEGNTSAKSNATVKLKFSITP